MIPSMGSAKEDSASYPNHQSMEVRCANNHLKPTMLYDNSNILGPLPI